MHNDTPHGMLVFQNARLVYANPRALEMAALRQDEMTEFSPQALFSLAHPGDRERLHRLWRSVEAGELASPETNVCFQRKNGDCFRVDVLINQAIYQERAAIQVNWIDNSPHYKTLESLQEEERRRQEAVVMRDVMVALATAGNLKQSLEVLLVHLHDVIHYDRAGLFLVDEEERYVMAGGGLGGENASRAYLENDPLVFELRSAQKPIIVEDVQVDPRFSNWPDLESVHGWMGAPLLAGEQMIGFLTLGSLQVGAYNQADVELMRSFASQVADVLARAWFYEKSNRRTEELEVLSSFSFALGQAESSENTLFAILEQIARTFGASRGAFLSMDRSGSYLVIRASLDESVMGLIHPQKDDLLWQVFRSGKKAVIQDVSKLAAKHPYEIYSALFLTAGAGIIIPLCTGETVFGLLTFGLTDKNGLRPDNLHLYDAIAEIASASLHRAVVLEALERQIHIRTQHLSTLYNINSLAGEALGLGTTLERILDITLEAMKCKVGAIHFLDDMGEELVLAAQRNVPLQALDSFEKLSLRQSFWRDLVGSNNPLVLSEVSAEQGASEELVKVSQHGIPAYIGATIRAKGQTLGLLSVFGETMLDYSVEDITLFMTIADQIGGSVERARLMHQAELAAVVDERQRLARELHDSVTQLLYGQVLFSGASLKVLRQDNLELAEQHLARIEQAARQALREMRLLVYQLQPSDYLAEGLATALERRLDSVERRSGIDARLRLEGDLDLDEATEMTFYRVAEEALNNTLKHAGAHSVQVDILALNGTMRLEICDDGCGFDPGAASGTGGMGLTSMSERSAAVGGKLEIHSAPGQGTRIILEVEVSA